MLAVSEDKDGWCGGVNLLHDSARVVYGDDLLHVVYVCVYECGGHFSVL